MNSDTILPYPTNQPTLTIQNESPQYVEILDRNERRRPYVDKLRYFGRIYNDEEQQQVRGHLAAPKALLFMTAWRLGNG